MLAWLRHQALGVLVKAVLHIGTEKTGSTSIQRMLRHNRRVLADQGYITAPFLGGASQIGLSVVALSDDSRRKVHRRLGLSSRREIVQYRDKMAIKLDRAIAGSEGSVLLLSSEQLSYVVDDEAKVERLLTWLRKRGVEPSALVYLRRQDRLLESSYQQRVKAGFTGQLVVPPEEVAGHGSKYDYWAMLSRWSAGIGKCGVRARVFERSELIGGDVVTDYIAQVGIREDGLELPRHENPSMSAPAVEFLRLMNEYLPARSSGPNDSRGNISSLLRKIASDGPPLRLSSEDAQRFLARFADGNRRVAEDFLGNSRGELFVLNGFADSVAERLTVEQAVELSARLWLAKQREFSALRTGGAAEAEPGILAADQTR